MRFGAVTIAYRDEAIIAGTIKCLKPFVSKHIVLISEKPYYGETEPPDKTEEIAESLGCEVVKGTWSLDHQQRTLGNQLCSDCDWVFGFDSDEMMTSSDLEKLCGVLGEVKYHAIANNPEVYWRTTDYVFRPRMEYNPIIAMRPYVGFSYIRNIDRPYAVLKGVTLHHLSWCEPKDILRKVSTYAHADEFPNHMEWFDKHYLGWKYPDEVTFPQGKFKVEKQRLPEELCQYLGISK